MKVNNQNMVELYFLIYATSRSRLWMLRDMLYEIQETLHCKLNLSLTCNLQTAYDMFAQEPEGMDVFLNDEMLPKQCEAALKRRIAMLSPMCQTITRQEQEYVYTYPFEKEIKIMERWKADTVSLEEKLYDLLERMIKKASK